jgi:hypothetical protein
MTMVDNNNSFYKNTKITGELRSISSTYNYEEAKNTSDLALGGFIKYEVFPSDTLNMAVALRTSKDLIHDNGELSSRSKEHASMTQLILITTFKI